MSDLRAHLPAEFLPFLDRCPALTMVGNTPLVRLDLPELQKPGVEVYAKMECFNPGGSIKDRPVMFMLLSALRDGVLTPERTVIDSSSGNAGIAYASIGKALGLNVKLVIPENASEERKKRMIAHGAEIHFTDAIEGYDEALREVRRQADADPEKYFFCDQYGNENNWRAHYYTTAAEILEQTDRKVTHFVAGVGTGGTITGNGRRLKEEIPGLQVTCVMPDAFPGIEGLKPLESEEDIVPDILDESVIDQKIPVNIEDAYDMCQKLATRGFFVGQSSGAYVHVAAQIVKQIDSGIVVTVLNDFGERYFSTRLWG